MNHNIKILKLANSCEFLKSLEDDHADFCIRDNFLNAILNRWNGRDTEEDVSKKLSVSKRTVYSLEKLQVSNINTILKYIHIYGKDNARDNQRKNQNKYYKSKR